jgi:orotate phosphoribosyltransferase
VCGNAKPEGAGDIAFDITAGSLDNKICLHISDLVTEASSFACAWHPAVKAAGGNIAVSLTVVDRMQGGGDVISGVGVEHCALTGIGRDLFDSALEQGHINDGQYRMILEYIADPKKSMQAFINGNPGFIESALAGGGKDAERAKKCIENRIYNIH